MPGTDASHRDCSSRLSEASRERGGEESKIVVAQRPRAVVLGRAGRGPAAARRQTAAIVESLQAREGALEQRVAPAVNGAELPQPVVAIQQRAGRARLQARCGLVDDQAPEAAAGARVIASTGQLEPRL